MTRVEAENLSKWPEGYSCTKCDSSAIECFGEEDEGEVRFGCVQCGYTWREEIEDDEVYLSEQERKKNNDRMLKEVSQKAEQDIVERETIAKIDFAAFSRYDFSYIPFELIHELARLKEWVLIDEIIGKCEEQVRLQLTNGAVAKWACQDLDSLQRYTELMEKHIAFDVPRLYWFMSGKFFRTESYGDTPRFISLIIRLWQHHMKVGRKCFVEIKSINHSDKGHFLRFKERFWDEMSEAQRVAMNHIEENARECR